jgi:PBS lyase HEAT-like repeat
MYLQSKLLLVYTLLAVSLFGEVRNVVAQSVPESPEQKISKLESKIGELEKKVEVRPKDKWDKLGAISGLVSGLLIAVIGGFVTVIFKRRETALLEAQSKREDEDRKAQLQLEILGNERAETQLEIERQNKEREIAISQAQTIQSFLPSLQSNDQKTQETALMLIAFLGNPELAAKLSSLYKTDLTSTLTTIASMPGLKLEQRRQAAAALGNLGHPEEAANKLVELSSQPAATNEERIVIAEELEALGDVEKAAKVQLELAVDPHVEAEKRRDAVEALKRLAYTEKAKPELLQIARNEESKTTKRIAAIEALSQLDETEKTSEESIALLINLIRSPEMDPKEFRAAVAALRQIGPAEKATEVVKEIAGDARVKVKLRLEAATDNWEQGHKEEALQTFREIADSAEASDSERLLAAISLEKGSPEEGKEKKQKIAKEMASHMWVSVKDWFRRKPSSAT